MRAAWLHHLLSPVPRKKGEGQLLRLKLLALHLLIALPQATVSKVLCAFPLHHGTAQLCLGWDALPALGCSCTKIKGKLHDVTTVNLVPGANPQPVRNKLKTGLGLQGPVHQ